MSIHMENLHNLLNLDEVGIAGNVKRHAASDHDVLAGTQMAGLACGLYCKSNQIVSGVRWRDQNRDDAPGQCHKVECLLVWSCRQNRLLRTKTRYQCRRRARPRGCDD